MNHGLLGVLLTAYLLGLLALSVYASRRVQTEEDYLVAGRRLPLFLAWGTLLATWFGAATLLGAAEAARREGLRGTILDPYASGLALIVAGIFFARPLWDMRLLTLADFYGRKFGPRAEVLASLIMVPGYFGWIGAQYLALASMQLVFFDVPLDLGIFIACIVVLGYTMVGGMWSVTLTDTLQIVVVLALLVVLAIETLSELAGASVAAGIARLIDDTPADFMTMLPAAGGAAGIAWLATWSSGIFGNIPGQDLMQRVFAARDANTARWACIVAGVIYIAFGSLPVMLGLASRLLYPGEHDMGIMFVLAQQYVTDTMSAVFVLAVVSVVVSTCTSAVLSPAAVLGHNLMMRLPGFRRRSLMVERAAVLLVAACGVAAALSGKSILELLEVSLSIGAVSLFVPLVMGIYGNPRGERAALLSMLFGIAVWLPREALEMVLVPMPENAPGAYFDYVYQHLIGRGWPAAVASLGYGFALLPSTISGTAFSALGYLLGHVTPVPDKRSTSIGAMPPDDGRDA